MIVIPNTTTTANYTDVGAASFPADTSGGGTQYTGGTVVVANASVFMSVLLGTGDGQLGSWSQDTLISPTTVNLAIDPLSHKPRTLRGVRFRDAVAGTHAQIFGALFQPGDPTFVPGTQFTGSIAANGGFTTGGALITGIIPTSGATQTAGSGFTYTHTNGSGVYVFTFTTAFAAAPTVLATLVVASSFIYITNVTASGFTVNTLNSAGVAADRGFNFLAAATV